MKKPNIEKIRSFLVTIGLKDSLLNKQTDDGTCVVIKDISSFYVDGEVLCNAQDAVLTLESSLKSKPERIKDYEGITWRFKIPLYGYVSIEERLDNSVFLRLDNGI